MDGPWDVVVVGAGAAGLMAGISAAESGKRTLVLEKNRRPGVKILMSGGTRCNITHATDNRGIVAAYGQPGRFLHSALAGFGVEETVAFFEAEGVATKVEETGKIFPVSDRAADVVAALVGRLQRSGADLAPEEPVRELAPLAGGFRVDTAKRTVGATSVILTTGGLSYPGSGTTGDGYAMAKAFGHTIIPTRPALTPLAAKAPWVTDLRGLTLPDVGVTIRDGDQPLARRRGSLLFTHFGLSGPVVLDVSRVVSGHPNPRTLSLDLDAVPHRTEADVDDMLKSGSVESGKKQLAAVLSSAVPRRLAEAMMSQAGLAADRKAAGLSKPERLALGRAVKALAIPVDGTLGYAKAEVTAGGVALDEIDSRSMQSKRAPGLFVAGELLDLDGPIGGYNFQAAWSTGWLAGRRA